MGTVANAKPITRNEALARLRALEPELRQRGMASLYLFGSVARDQAGATSDIDLFCDLRPDAPVGVFAFLGIGERLTEALGRKVDLATRASLHRLIRDQAVAEAAQVF